MEDVLQELLPIEDLLYLLKKGGLAAIVAIQVLPDDPATIKPLAEKPSNATVN